MARYSKQKSCVRRVLPLAQTRGFSRALATVRRTVAARRDAKRRARAVRIPPCSPCIVCCKNKKQHPAGCCLWRRWWEFPAP